LGMFKLTISRNIQLLGFCVFILVVVVGFYLGPKAPGSGADEKHFCSIVDRASEACMEVYDPVCGWFDPGQIQCIRYPCAATYSNSCFACIDSKVHYWTRGECP
jgi:hypothetical protein